MGKSKSAPAPAAPSPRETGAAQTATNIGSAIAQQNLANINQRTPYGDLIFSETGTYKYVDPLNNKTHVIPKFTAEQRLDPAQQAILDENNATSLNLARLGNSQAVRARDLLSRTVKTNGLPSRGDPGSLSGLDLERAAGARPLQSTLPNAGYIQGGLGDSGSIRGGDFGAGGAARVTGTSGLNTAIDSAGPVARSFDDAGSLRRTYGDDFSEDRGRVESALFDRLNPQLDRDRARLETQLADQGIQVGSEAYSAAIEDFNRGVNDARLAIIAQGGAEQSRLTGLEAQRAGFENAAQAQAYQQAFGRGQFGNAAQAQQFAQSAQEAGFANDALMNEQQRRIGLAQANNAAQAQDFGQREREAAFANQAQQQRFAQNLSAGQFANDAQARRFQQEADRAAFANDAAQTDYANQLQTAAFNNQAAVQEQNSSIARFDAANSARNQALQEQFAVRNQPLNEITALMSGSQVQSPSFINPYTAQLATTDFAGIQANANSLAQRQRESQARSSDALIGGLLGFGGALVASDRRVKKGIRKIGKTDDGQPIYKFRYKSGGPIQMGLMAQDVEKRRPSAVKKVGGIKMVDYGKALAGA